MFVAAEALTAATVAASAFVGCLTAFFLCGEVGGEIAVSVYFATADPYFYADDAYFGVGFYKCVVDVGTKGVEGCTAFLEHFGASHFSAVETAGNLHLDAFCACTHCGGYCHFHCATVSDFAFDLTGDGGGHDLCVEFGAFYFEYVDLDVFVGDLAKFFFEFLNVLAGFADDESGARGAHCDGDELECALDYHAAYRAFCEANVEVFAEFGVFEDCVAVFTTAEPVGVPSADNAKTVGNRIYFLSH